jgi:hypothetical protein
MCVMVPFVNETPRFLINHGQTEQGLRNPCRLRQLPEDHPYVQLEYQGVIAQVQFEQRCYQGHSYWTVMKDIFLIASNR